MSWVAVGTAAVGVVSAYAQADAKKGQGGAGGISGGGDNGMNFQTASAASYGTNIGNDGWSINFGSGSQTTEQVKTTTSTYPTEQNPLSALQPVQVLPDQAAGYGAGMSTQDLLLLGVGALVVVKLIRK
ncbi:MAG: hypothetical protein ABI433_07195 [Burkholderiaceae bacterium]